MLVIIENVSLARDHRARKQVGALLSSGYDVSVICRRDPDNAQYRNMKGLKLYEFHPPRESSRSVSFLYEYAFSWLLTCALTIWAFAERGFAVIQAGGPPDIHFLLALPFKLLRRRFLVDQRDLSPEVYVARYGKERGALLFLVRQFERLSWRAADHVFCVNRSLRDTIAARGGVPSASLTVVGNGPVLERTFPRTPRPGLKEGRPFLICWIGLMGPQDHVELALEMVYHLVYTLNRKDCHVAFIGDGEALPELQRYADQLHITAWISFTGWLDEDHCFEYLSTADVALDSNLQEEVSPVKGMEYMAFGVPFAAFDLKETRLMADRAAVYVPPGDVPGLAQAITDLLDDPASRAEMGRIGRRRIQKHLAWEIQQDAFLGVYERLISPVDYATQHLFGPPTLSGANI